MIKLRARAMKAAAIVAIGILFASVGVNAASANEAVDNPNSPEYWEAQYPNTVCVKYDNTDQDFLDNSYGSVIAEGQSVVLKMNQALLVVKGGSLNVGDGAGNNVFVNPVAGDSYQSPSNGGGSVPAVSHWIVCEFETLTSVFPEFPNPGPPDCDAAGSLPAKPADTADIVYTWDGNTLKATATPGNIIPAGTPASRTYVLEPATGYQSNDPQGECYSEGQPEGLSGETVESTGQCTVPVDGTVTTVTTTTAWTQEYVLNTETGRWSLGEKVPGEPVVSSTKASSDACAEEVTDGAVTASAPTVVPVCGPNNDMVTIPTTEGVTYTAGDWVDGQYTVTAAANADFELIGDESWTFTDEDTACPIEVITDAGVVATAPTVVPLCGPNNDSVNLPAVAGVKYASSPRANGTFTVTATADAGYALMGPASWTFTDTPLAACPDEGPVFAFTPQEELADTGTSSTTGGLIGLAMLLIAGGTALVTRKVRA